MSDYWKCRESHLKAQKKYDDKNREKKREYDKKRWQKQKQLQNNWNELKKWLIQLQKFKGINQQGFSWGVAQEVLNKMQELEEEKDG